ncbi:DUF1570 domain-containing protein [Tautonia sociabilis]|uniref:DUF1570 domain-containing protein n=1 Tax=Tautonia sociabilis TaxID=2080755 RepID=UPI00131513A2|nr:DUF1570 domain-containing protein [Tautonia sociabilis]
MACLAATAIALPPAAAGPSSDAITRDRLRLNRSEIREAESTALSSIADRLDRQGDSSRAARVRDLIPPPPPIEGPRRFDPLPEIVPPAEPSAPDASPDDPIAEEIATIRNKAADAYADLARRAFEAERLSLADACLREVLRRRPDDPEARRLLGFVPHEGGWATPHAVSRLKNGDILHPIYGWIPSEYLPELERGLLPAPSRPGRPPSRWLPAEEADAMRLGSISSGWQITTPHFKIQASVPLAEGIAFARRLEAFYDLFTSLAADVIGPRLPLAQLFRNPDATAPAVAARQHQVLYFGTKRQYVDYLTSLLRDTSIENTLGVYLDDRKVSSFFKDEGGDLAVEATLYHEVSHQLLFELAGPSGYRRNAGDYWVFEGLGTYFETVEAQPDGSLRYGGRIGPRVAEARTRLVERGELVPTDRFVRFDREEWSQDTDLLPLYYAQAIALTIFLMDDDLASLRDAFLDYVADAYRGRLRAGASASLSSHLGMSYDELDRALIAFLSRPPAPGAPTDR